jgi:hypothetical protein
MEQVAANHGVGISEIHALCAKDLLKSPRDIEPPKSFQEFYDFPKECGWNVNEDFTLGVSEHSGSQQDKAFFIQAWLFFGLIFTVIQKDKKPVLEFGKLVNKKYLSTDGLHDAIEKWTDWERTHPDGLRFRMIQVGWVLELARHVIQKSYAYDYASDEDTHSADDADTASINPGEKIEQEEVSDQSVLVLMCLGETLSAAKARIVEMNKVDTKGWHGDDHAGWGLPSHVFELMKKSGSGWCPRAMEILRGQVSSNATMLVAAYQAYQKSSRMTEGHTGCTRKECKVKSLDRSGNYKNRHTDKCIRNRSRNCKPCGPREDDILGVLRKGGKSIPLLKLYDDPNEGKKFEVISFDPNGDDSIDSKFVTISHVWSDGWGNEAENKLNSCQIDFIHRQITRATNSSDTPFWMDTLVVPVAKGQEEHRMKAIRQICDVFESSSYTIILDNGLSSMDQGGPDKPAEAAMKIFSSVWMRRLWTLQEAYLSRNILIPFLEESAGTDNLTSLDSIEDHLDKFMEKSTSGITQMVRIQLSRMIMGEERRSRKGPNKVTKEKLLRQNAPTLVANAYRAARWRVSFMYRTVIISLLIFKDDWKNRTRSSRSCHAAQS